MAAKTLPAPVTTFNVIGIAGVQNNIIKDAQNIQDSQSSAITLTDVPYIPPDTSDNRFANINKGAVGAFQVENTGFVSGGAFGGTDKIGMLSEKNNERFFVGNRDNPNTVVGQLRSKTGIDEYGIWTDNGYFSGAITAATIDIGGADATSFHVDIDGNLWSGAASFATAPFTVANNGFMTLGPVASTYIQFDGPNAKIQSSNYLAGVRGFLVSPDLIEAENLKARGQMKGVTFQYDVVSAVGGQLMVANSDTLSTDMTALDTSSLTVTGSSTFAVNDILVIRATTATGIQEEWLRVTSIASAPTYAVTRDLAAVYAANSNPIWLKGTTVTKQGTSDGAAAFSGGWLRLFGEGTNSPYYSVFSRTGVNYNNYTERVRIGNLKGIGSFASDTFGVFMGDPTLVGNYFSYDDLSGQVILNGRRFTADPIFGDGSDGAMVISVNTTLSSDIFPNTLVVNTGITLDTGSYRIFSKVSVTLNGTAKIVRNGDPGGNGGNASGSTGGTAGAAAAALASGSIFGGAAGTVGLAGSNGVASPSGGVAGTAGTAGAAITSSIGVAGVAGVAGAAGGTGNSGTRAGGAAGALGAAGSLTAAKASVRTAVNASIAVDTSLGTLYTGGSQPGGSGGSGSGGSGTAGTSGAGGGSGACGAGGGIVLIASPTITIGASASIQAKGGAGGNGGNGGSNGTNAGGGGGGSSGSGGTGGEVILIYTTLNNSGSITVTGGAPGTPGTGGAGTGTGANGSNGNTGNTGSTGTIYQLQLL